MYAPMHAIVASLKLDVKDTGLISTAWQSSRRRKCFELENRQIFK